MRRLVVAGVFAAVAGTLGPLPAHATPESSTSSADAAIIEAGLLTINDLPPGWRESPSSSSSTPNLSKYGKSCARLQAAADAAKKLQTAHSKSPKFKQGSIDEIDNAASVFRTDAATATALAIFKRPELVPCFQKAITALAKKSAPAGLSYSTSIGKLSMPQLGDDTIGYEFVVKATKNGVTATVYIDLQLVQVGRAGLTFSFEGEGSSPLLANQALVQTVVARVRAAETTS